MFIYVVTFVLSVLFIFLSRRLRYRQLRKLCAIIGILLPAILAGCRAATIGVDVSVYAIPSFEQAVHSKNIIAFFSRQRLGGNTDLGFNFIVYAVSLLANDYHWSLFVYELIAVWVMYLGMSRLEKQYGIPVWLGMLFYYLTIYNASLNIMRQAMAVSFVFLAFTYLTCKEYKKYAVLMVVAFLMHSSAVIGFVILPLYLILQVQNGSSEKKQIFRGLFVIAGVMVIAAAGPQIVRMLVHIGLFRENYLKYLQGGSYSTISQGRSISIAELMIQLAYIAVFLMYYRIMNRKGMQGLFYLMISGMVLAITCFSPLFAEYISRMSYYFIPLQMVGLTNTTLCYKKSRRGVWTCLILLFVFATWLRTYVFLGYHATVPYEFFWG